MPPDVSSASDFPALSPSQQIPSVHNAVPLIQVHAESIPEARRQEKSHPPVPSVISTVHIRRFTSLVTTPLRGAAAMSDVISNVQENCSGLNNTFIGFCRFGSPPASIPTTCLGVTPARRVGQHTGVELRHVDSGEAGLVESMFGI